MLRNKLLILIFILSLIFIIFIHFFRNKPEGFIAGLKSGSIVPLKYPARADNSVLPVNFSTVGIINLDTAETNFSFSWRKLFNQAGIAYRMLNSFDQLRLVKMAVIVKNIDNPVLLSEGNLKAIREFVAGGGTLIGDGVLSLREGQLKDVFGWRDYFSSKSVKKISFTDEIKCRYFDDTMENNVILSNMDESIWVNVIRLGEAKPVAIFDRDKPLISLNHYMSGKALLFGFSLYDVYVRNLTGRHFSPYTKYVNGFEPMSDVFLLFIKSLYEQSVPLGLTLNTAPAAYKSTVIFTHDVDFSNSVNNSLKFAAMEEKANIRSTFFIQAKYLDDYNDKAFLTPGAIEIMKSLAERGFEIGSHTVIHSMLFPKFSLGTGLESYPDYVPMTIGKKNISGEPTLLGEIRIPKMIFNAYGVKLDSFRPGHLGYNRKLSDALEASGYYCSSTFTCGDVMTYYPFRLLSEKTNVLKDSDIIEIPVAIEDEESPLSGRLEQSLALFKKISNNGGVACILIHPDLTESKGKHLDCEFEEKLIKKLPAGCWVTTLRKAGEFWRNRGLVDFYYETEEARLKLTVVSPVEMENLSFNKNAEFKILNSNDFNVKIEQEKIILKKVKEGTNEIILPFKEF